MRPPVLPSGNAVPCVRSKPPARGRACFNEAAGFTQRKRSMLAAVRSLLTRSLCCFNEAAGFTQRKPPILLLHRQLDWSWLQ